MSRNKYLTKLSIRLVVLESGLGLESGLEYNFAGLELGLGLGLACQALGLGLGLGHPEIESFSSPHIAAMQY